MNTRRDDKKWEGRAAVVLLAEDDPAQRFLACRALKRAGIKCDFRTVNDGEQAMAYLQQEGQFSSPDAAPRPDLMLLDLNMPKLDGRQVLERMKSTPGLATIPVVVLTTSQLEADIAKSYESGCNSYLTKPVDVDKFLDLIRELGSYWLQLVELPTDSPKSDGTVQAEVRTSFYTLRGQE